MDANQNFALAAKIELLYENNTISVVTNTIKIKVLL